jgi:hypothetical protein
MTAFALRIALVAVSLGSHVVLAFADSPPNLNAGPSCDAAARFALSFGRSKTACMDDERAAQDQLTKNWSQYSAAHRSQCVGMVTTGGPPSFVELLSCLEIMRDAAAIHQNDPVKDDRLGNPPAQATSRRTRTSANKNRPVASGL